MPTEVSMLDSSTWNYGWLNQRHEEAKQMNSFKSGAHRPRAREHSVQPTVAATAPSAGRVNGKKRNRIIPLWRYLSYTPPAGMQLNPDRERTRDYLINNVFSLAWTLVPAAFAGWGISLLMLLLGGMFVDFPAVVEGNLWALCAAIIFWRNKRDDMHLEARCLGREESRYIPIADTVHEIEHERRELDLSSIERLADTTPSSELRQALIQSEPVLRRWDYGNAVGSTNKRIDYMIEAVIDACATMNADRSLINSELAQIELMQTVNTSMAKILQQLEKDADLKSSDFGATLRALRSQMGLGTPRR
jgi:hypothetical protein